MYEDGRHCENGISFRPLIPIVGLTTDEQAYRKLALSWGVLPAMADEYSSVDILSILPNSPREKADLSKKET
ncbi:MAG: pyruvate kinase alpha/beta domain-containing protein [Christensenellaceae bacterium]